MSNAVLFPLALLGVFSAVVTFTIAVQTGRAERARAIELLETQVKAPSVFLREEELALPFSQRALAPVVSGLGEVGRRVTPGGIRRRIARKLVLAGSPAGWDADKVAALKVLGTVVGFALAFFVTKAVALSGLTSTTMIMVGTLGGYLSPDLVLDRKVEERQKALRRALPDTMDLLTISVEAGLGFDAAMAQVIHNVPGPLSQEMGRMLQEIQLGVTRADAFRHLAARTNVDEMSAFVLAMIQADVFGISIANVLRAQAKELRVRRRQNAERIAMQIPVKILFPMILCVMPALFIVVLGPGTIRIFRNFGGF
jgi:tight adherence protein C